MRIEADALIDFPRDLVFRTYRDELPQIVEGLPRVKEIMVEERQEEGGVTHIKNLWRGSAQVPASAAKVLPPMVSWHDHARWDQGRYQCDWSIDSHVFPEAVRCTGENRFVDLGGKCRGEIRGEIRIDLSKVAKVPDLVASPIATAVERFLVRQITPNLLAVSEALSEHLAAKG